MISITSITGSSDGVILQESRDSKFKKMEPRVTKSRALDGTVVYDHRGMITVDREFRILVSNPTSAQVEALQAIIENETFINFACKEGFFQGIIKIAELDKNPLDFDFFIKQDLTVEA